MAGETDEAAVSQGAVTVIVEAGADPDPADVTVTVVVPIDSDPAAVTVTVAVGEQTEVEPEET